MPDERAPEPRRAPTGRARALFDRAFGPRKTVHSGEFKDSGVGRLLCATRMRLGKDLQYIAQVLHIRYTYLVAIEDGRYEDLPGQAYAIGFVRAYADHLELDGDEIVRRFKEESTGLKRKAALDFPIPTPDSGIPSGMSLLAAMLLGMAVYGSWYAVSGPKRQFALVQEVPTRLLPPKVEPAAPAAEPAPAASPAAAEAVPPAESEDAASEAPQPPTATSPSGQATPLATDDGGGTGAVLELRAKADCWIQIRKDESLLLTKLLHKGDVYRVPDERGLTLMTANAGGVEVLVNGEVMPPLGETGAVASGIPLEAAHFKSGE